MTPQELRKYFDENPPPLEIEWRPWAKIVNSRVFLDNAFTCISLFKGNYRNCPDYWHLVDLYEHLTGNKVNNP